MTRFPLTLPLAGGAVLNLEFPAVMGILNATPDSFSDGGEIDDPRVRARRIEQMISSGVDIIDVGGESTRPGHTPVAADDEIRRVLPVIRDIRHIAPDVPISIDTRKAAVAAEAIAEGANMVNDVSGLADEGMPTIVSEEACSYVAMRSADCEGPILDCCRQQLSELAARATSAGISEGAIIVDPGLGFGARPGPSLEDNLSLVDGADDFSPGRPVLIGASRKRFVRRLAGESRAALVAGSIALAIRAAKAGASIVRVHDVEETIAAFRASGLRPPSS